VRKEEDLKREDLRDELEEEVSEKKERKMKT
jgi:hypothetical protein